MDLCGQGQEGEATIEGWLSCRDGRNVSKKSLAVVEAKFAVPIQVGEGHILHSLMHWSAPLRLAVDAVTVLGSCLGQATP